MLDDDSFLFYYLRYILFFFIYLAIIFALSLIFDLSLGDLMEEKYYRPLAAGLIVGECALKLKRDGFIYGSFRMTHLDSPATFYPTYYLLWAISAGCVFFSVISNNL